MCELTLQIVLIAEIFSLLLPVFLCIHITTIRKDAMLSPIHNITTFKAFASLYSLNCNFNTHVGLHFVAAGDGITNQRNEKGIYVLFSNQLPSFSYHLQICVYKYHCENVK